MQEQEIENNIFGLPEMTGETTAPVEQAPVSPMPEAPALRFIPYNTGMKQMPLPEYGRNVQNLIDYCLTIEDRAERTDCAFAIADVMDTLFPQLSEGGDNKKIWDQMQIMSGFRLDVDLPYEPLTEEAVHPKPERLPYQNRRMRFRHYGSSVEHMVEEVCKMENSEEKDVMVNLLANHMKKLLTLHNKEGVSDARVLHDLALFSKGHIILDPETYPLAEFQEEVTITPTKKRKQKKNR